MRLPYRIVCAVVLTILCAIPAAAQDGQMGGMHQMWYVLQEEHVSPGMVKQYEAATKAWIAAIDKAGLPLYFFAMKDMNGTYTYIVMINKFAEIDTIGGYWAQATKLLDEKTAAERRDSIQWSRYTIWLGMPQFSYSPAKPELTMESAMYMEYADIRVRAKDEHAFIGAVMKIKAVYEKHGINRGWEIYRGIVGMQGPAYTVVWAGKDPGDVWGWFMSLKPEFNAELMPVMQELAGLMEGEVQGRAWMKPELSRMPKGN